MKNMNLRKIAVLAGLFVIPVVSHAGTTSHSGKETKAVVETPKESWITGDIGVDIYSQYIFHGLTLENQGVILQPYADLYFKLMEGDGFLNAATLNLGIWNSFHSRHTVRSSTEAWYEFDFLAGVSFTFAKNFTFTPTYIAYTSPGDYFGTSHNLQLRLAYNDADAMGNFALNPYVLVEFELDGKSGNGSDEGVYYEVGISPGTKFGPVSVNVPIKAGFGSSDYYSGDESFGFISAGIVLGYQLPVSERWGTWTATASATYFHYGDANSDANSVKGDGRNDVVFGGGLKVAF